jgi:cbb3-type cytochrome oxidase maturation protein
MTSLDFWLYATMLVSILFFGTAAILALAWGIRNQQFENFERSAQAIFDPDEPIGEITDRFPEDSTRK